MAVVLAYGTEKQAYFDLFMESCHRFGIEPVILGWGDQWEGTCKKLSAIYEYIRELPDHETVLSVDPFDVVFLAGLDEIEEKFARHQTPFLCGALKLRSFNARVYHHEFNRTGLPAPETPTGYNFLNAGTWISTAGYASGLLNRLTCTGLLQSCDIDQEVFTALYIRDCSVMDIDWKCSLFQNILFTDFITRRPDLSDIRIHNNRIMNPSTDTQPSILHASGNVVMREIASSLGYPDYLTIPEKDLKNYTRKAVFHLGKILRYSVTQKFSPVSAHAR